MKRPGSWPRIVNNLLDYQNYKGEIKVEDELGKGTAFTIILSMYLEKQLENHNN